MPSNLLNNRALVRLSPSDASENVRQFLQGLVTNDVSGNLPAYAALLSAQGKTMFDFLVWADGDDVLLDCEAEHADELVKRLSLYRLRRKITIEREDKLGSHWSPVPVEGAVPDPRHSGLGYRWLAADTGNATDGIDSDYRAQRLRLGIPEGRAEMGDILWLETNAVELNGVNFEKGCYIGQENTARMNWRQKVNRRLVVVPAEASDQKRQKAHYPELGLAVDHLRVADLDPQSLPEWLRTAIQPAGS